MVPLHAAFLDCHIHSAALCAPQPDPRSTAVTLFLLVCLPTRRLFKSRSWVRFSSLTQLLTQCLVPRDADPWPEARWTKVTTAYSWKQGCSLLCRQGLSSTRRGGLCCEFIENGQEMISFSRRTPEPCCLPRQDKATQIIEDAHPWPEGYQNYLSIVQEWQVRGNNEHVDRCSQSPASLCPNVSALE